MRTFDTGATRDTDIDKHDYEGFLSPLVVQRFGEYMSKHRVQADGTIRASDNWQKGIPKDAYIKSAFRHFVSWWRGHRKLTANEDTEEALCAVLFNVQGYLHEVLMEKEHPMHAWYDAPESYSWSWFSSMNSVPTCRWPNAPCCCPQKA